MSRTMGDATHDGVSSLPAGLDLVAGYVTGSPDIQWTAADFARFPGIPHVTIDQGFTGAPRYDATVIDVETGAYAVPSVAVWMDHATASRPTLYVNRSNVTAACQAALASTRFKGDVWLAYPGLQPGQPLPPLPPGCRYVAVQNVFTASYDLSEVLDPTWPTTAATTQEEGMLIIWGTTEVYLLSGGRMHKITPGEAALYQSAGIPQTTGPVASDAEIAALLADFPPGNPAVTVGNVTVPNLTITGTVAQSA